MMAEENTDELGSAGSAGEANAVSEVEPDEAETSDDSLIQGYITVGIVVVVAMAFVVLCVPMLLS